MNNFIRDKKAESAARLIKANIATASKCLGDFAASTMMVMEAYKRLVEYAHSSDKALKLLLEESGEVKMFAEKIAQDFTRISSLIGDQQVQIHDAATKNK